MSKIYLVCYDISETSVRSKLSNKLLQLGLMRWQKSVFCGKCKPFEIIQLNSFIATLKVDKSRDSIILIPLFSANLTNTIQFAQDDDVISSILKNKQYIYFE